MQATCFMLFCADLSQWYCSRAYFEGGNYFSMPSSTDAACGGALCEDVCVLRRRVDYKTFEKRIHKATCPLEFRSAHQEGRGEGDTADCVNQNGDLTGTFALLFHDPLTLVQTTVVQTRAFLFTFFLSIKLEITGTPAPRMTRESPLLDHASYEARVSR